MNSITTSIRLEINDVDDATDALIHQRLMRPQQAAMRSAYRRLISGGKDKVVWHELREKFPNFTGRNINDAMLSAKAVLRSQRERLPNLIDALNKRIKRIDEKLDAEHKRQNGMRPERAQAMSSRKALLEKRHDELSCHAENNTVPSAIFGGRKLWADVSRGKENSRTEWRHQRSNSFLSRGAKNYKGNPHCRLSADGETINLLLRIPNDRTEETQAQWLKFTITYSRPYYEVLRRLAVDGASGNVQYTMRLIRLAPRRYRAFVTLDEPVAHQELTRAALPTWCQKIVGIDLNLDHIALVLTDKQGQFLEKTVFKFASLGELPRDKSKWQTGNLARDAIAWLKEQGGQAIVVEDLNITRNSKQTKLFNRHTVPFAYRQLANALIRRGLREGLMVKRVNPAYTSWIGRLKYMRQFGISVHVAAAFVIARRGVGLQERIPEHLVRAFPSFIALIENDIAKRQKDKSGEEADDRKIIAKRREWVKRLNEWKSCSPQTGRPWLLWATLQAASKNISEVRDALYGTTTYGRNNSSCQLRSAGNTWLGATA